MNVTSLTVSQPGLTYYASLLSTSWNSTRRIPFVSISFYMLHYNSYHDYNNYRLTFNSGELSNTATKDQSSFLETSLNAEVSVSVYGRKLDMQLRIKPETLKKNNTLLELNNSEFKKHDTYQSDLELQLRKNIQVNHAILLRLNTKIGLPLDDIQLLALDVRGWMARIFCLRKMDDIWACGLACETAILLPHNKTSWDMFLRGHSIAMLWNYAVS